MKNCFMKENIYIIKNGNGKVKEYYDNGKLKFEGEYLNGKRNGKGKEYNYDGKLIFEGEYLYGNKLKGKEYINEKLKYEGDYLDNAKWNEMEKDMIYMEMLFMN